MFIFRLKSESSANTTIALYSSARISDFVLNFEKLTINADVKRILCIGFILYRTCQLFSANYSPYIKLFSVSHNPCRGSSATGPGGSQWPVRGRYVAGMWQFISPQIKNCVLYDEIIFTIKLRLITTHFSDGLDQITVEMNFLSISLISLFLKEATAMFTCNGPPSRIPSDEMAR